jgi:hypothetical protein
VKISEIRGLIRIVMKNKISFLLFLCWGCLLRAQMPATFTVQTDKQVAEVSPSMWGIFFEDINLGADGGLYAELIKNRSFEFEKPMMGWKIQRTQSNVPPNSYADFTQTNFLVVRRQDKNTANPRFLQVSLSQKDSLGLQNEGFRGIGIKKGVRYDFSVWYRQAAATLKMHLELVSEKGEILGKSVFTPTQTGES